MPPAEPRPGSRPPRCSKVIAALAVLLMLTSTSLSTSIGSSSLWKLSSWSPCTCHVPSPARPQVLSIFFRYAVQVYAAHLLRLLARVGMQCGFTVWAEWVSSEANTLPDCASRT